MGNQELHNARSRDIVGKVYPTNNHGILRVINYENTFNVQVEFLNTGFVTSTTYYQITRGQVRDKSGNRLSQRPYYGVGVLGYGGYTPTKLPRAYKVWRSMIMRCYCEAYLKTHPTYKGCRIASEWLDFQNFCEWYINQKKEIDFQLDKDIINKQSKLYSPETCILVPRNINYLFTNAKIRRGDYPIGIRKKKCSNRYEVSCNDGCGRQVSLGTYDSIEMGFNVYKKFKEEIIQKVAEEYRARLDPRAYRALLDYRVEITD